MNWPDLLNAAYPLVLLILYHVLGKRLGIPLPTLPNVQPAMTTGQARTRDVFAAKLFERIEADLDEVMRRRVAVLVGATDVTRPPEVKV